MPRTAAVAVGLITLSLLGTVVVSVAAADVGPGAAFGFHRLGGTNRFGTAAALAAAAFPMGAPTAILVTGSNFPDALAANYLAGQERAPILLVNQTAPLPPETVAALGALKTQRVILLGLHAAIGGDVQAQLSSLPSTAGGTLSVTRIGGQGRYDTMNLVDETPDPSTIGSIGGKRTAMVASGANFPDGLAGGPVAYAKSLPLVLTEPVSLTDQATQTLQDLGIQQVLIAGGPAAVSRGVERSINALGISTLARFAGTDRTDTARLIGDYAVSDLGFSKSHFDLASGDDEFAGSDTLALGPLAARQGPRAVVLLRSAAAPGRGALQFVKDNLATLQADSVNTLAGGQVAVPDAIVATVVSAFNTGTGWTKLPELVAAQIMSVTTRANGSPSMPAGTLVRFFFDEAIDGPIPPAFGQFFVYDDTLPNSPVGGAGGSFNPDSTVDPLNPLAVVVNFPSLDNASAVANLSLASVRPGAVTDLQGRTNPDGSAAIGVTRVTSSTATTAAPAAKAAVNPRPAAMPNAAAVDVQFDRPAFDQILGRDTTGFAIVYTDQHGPVQEAPCIGPGTGSTAASGGPVVGGNGTNIFTIVCPDDPATPDNTLSPSQVGRIVIRAGTVGTANAPSAGNIVAGFLQTAAFPHLATATPDLTDASLVPATTFGGNDGILVTVDQAVNDASVPAPATPPDRTKFSAILRDGSSVGATSVSRSPTSAARLIVTFAPGITGEAVGIEMLAGAVSALAGGFANADDEIAASNVPSVTVVPGRTAGPALKTVVLSPLRDASGAITAASALLTFNQPLAGPPAPLIGDLHGYDSDGTELTCTAPATGGGPAGFDASDDPFPDASAPATLQCDNWAVGPSSMGPVAALAQQETIILVTLDRGMLANVSGQYNPEQARMTTGGAGTPQQG